MYIFLCLSKQVNLFISGIVKLMFLIVSISMIVFGKIYIDKESPEDILTSATTLELNDTLCDDEVHRILYQDFLEIWTYKIENRSFHQTPTISKHFLYYSAKIL